MPPINDRETKHALDRWVKEKRWLHGCFGKTEIDGSPTFLSAGEMYGSQVFRDYTFCAGQSHTDSDAFGGKKRIEPKLYRFICKSGSVIQYFYHNGLCSISGSNGYRRFLFTEFHTVGEDGCYGFHQQDFIAHYIHVRAVNIP
jgi:hypothetical protein